MSDTRTKLSLPLWTERYAAPLAPASAAEMRARGWDYVDVVFVTGDAYVDHPSFAAAILHRVLERAGFRVAVLSQPDWKSAGPRRRSGGWPTTTTGATRSSGRSCSTRRPTWSCTGWVSRASSPSRSGSR